MVSLFLVVIAALLIIVSTLATPFNVLLLANVTRPSEDCTLSTRSSKPNWFDIPFNEEIYIISQSCINCDKFIAAPGRGEIYSRPEIVDCLSGCISRNNGHACQETVKMPLWRYYDDCCEECGGKMTTATLTLNESSGEIGYYKLDRVCTHKSYLSPTPVPRVPCMYRTNTLNFSDETVSAVDHDCTCGFENRKKVRTRYSFSLTKCAKKCISQMDGYSCSMLRMPLSSYYDRCCTSCGGENWYVRISHMFAQWYQRACIVPLAVTLNPLPTPRPPNCQESISIGESSYLSTMHVRYRCTCNRDLDTSGWLLYFDSEILNCYRSCLLERQGLNCYPNRFYYYFPKDCCSKCDGIDLFKKMIYRSSGAEAAYNKSVCTSISKAFASPLPSSRYSCKYSTRSWNMTNQAVAVIGQSCRCDSYKIDDETTFTYYTYSLEKCAINCIRKMDGNSCSARKMPLSAYSNSCCTLCGGVQWRVNVYTESNDYSAYAPVCIVPLASSPTPSPTPRALTCKYNTTIEVTSYLSTKQVHLRCQCNRDC